MISGNQKKRKPVMEALVAMVKAVRTLSQRDSAPAPTNPLTFTEGLTRYADNKYVVTSDSIFKSAEDENGRH